MRLWKYLVLSKGTIFVVLASIGLDETWLGNWSLGVSCPVPRVIRSHGNTGLGYLVTQPGLIGNAQVNTRVKWRVCTYIYPNYETRPCSLVNPYAATRFSCLLGGGVCSL